MVTLTESIVLSRSRAADLISVRKLNCWGSELSDIALLRSMKSVEVLSLSVNKIKTLADFAHCPNLQELYIRKNEIENLNDVCYLQDLSNLRSLWLADNPCSEAENYRLCVLKTLPKLQKLDNIAVKPEEVQDAMLYGDTLSLSNNSSKSNKVERTPSPPPRQSSTRKHSDSNEKIIESQLKPAKSSQMEFYSEPVKDDGKITYYSSPQTIQQSESYSSLEMSANPAPQDIMTTSLHGTQFHSYPPTAIQQVSSPVQSLTPSMDQHNSHPEGQGHPQAFQAKVQTLVEHCKVPGHQQAHVEQHQGSSSPFEPAMHPQHHSFDSVIHTCYEHNSSPAENGHRHSVTLPTTHPPHTGIPRSHSSGDRSSPTRVFSCRGKNRNANILSAALCLIKELDYANLEVVETAVQCRMLELEDYHPS
ncbi:Protein C21orf2 [Nymphon striatum]|nr:Protein C21orf2 [Nymphon striatum]